MILLQGAITHMHLNDAAQIFFDSGLDLVKRLRFEFALISNVNIFSGFLRAFRNCYKVSS